MLESRVPGRSLYKFHGHLQFRHNPFFIETIGRQEKGFPARERLSNAVSVRLDPAGKVYIRPADAVEMAFMGEGCHERHSRQLGPP